VPADASIANLTYDNYRYICFLQLLHQENYRGLAFLYQDIVERTGTQLITLLITRSHVWELELDKLTLAVKLPVRPLPACPRV
jgi:hypothetical protein